jgi:hypothetical protein
MKLPSLTFLTTALFAACFSSPATAQPRPTEREMSFPDVPGYRTLKVDLHMHTVFSDGSVWPNIRVEEAVREGLDAIAVTDHLEYQPHKDDIPHPDRNRSYNIATAAGHNLDSTLIIIRGSEITRSMPPGHANAIFLHDVNPMLVDDPIEAYREAANQEAFTFWNHPAWVGQQSSGIPELSDLHRRLITEGLLHGIEVVNMHDFSVEALEIALENDLVIIGTSDIHGLVDWEFEHYHFGHRPVTLVFASEKSESAIREALRAGRTTVWFRNTLIGRAEHLGPLVSASVDVVSAGYDRNRSVLAVELENASDVEFEMNFLGDYALHTTTDIVRLPPHSRRTLHIKTVDQLTSVSLPFEILNTVIAPDRHYTLSLDVTIE